MLPFIKTASIASDFPVPFQLRLPMAVTPPSALSAFPNNLVGSFGSDRLV
jgi:hypothetical protein